MHWYEYDSLSFTVRYYSVSSDRNLLDHSIFRVTVILLSHSIFRVTVILSFLTMYFSTYCFVLIYLYSYSVCILCVPIMHQLTCTCCVVTRVEWPRWNCGYSNRVTEMKLWLLECTTHLSFLYTSDFFYLSTRKHFNSLKSPRVKTHFDFNVILTIVLIKQFIINHWHQPSLRL